MRIVAFLMATCALAADAGPMSDSERAFLMDQLEQSKKAFLNSIAGLSQAQWTFKPDPAAWSVAECAEHIVLAEDFLFDTEQNALKTAPVARLADGTLEHDRKMAAGLLDRSQKYSAPPNLEPSDKYATPAEAARLFTEKRDRHIAYVKTTQDDLRVHTGSVPGVGPLDSYQLIVFTAAHSARHTEQIQEVESNRNYPK